jgi:hypothetical protein
MPHRKQQQRRPHRNHRTNFAAAKAAMTRKLTDPESARFDQLFKVTTDNGEAVCGLVNSKNRMGGYTGATGFIFEKTSNRATLIFSGDSRLTKPVHRQGVRIDLAQRGSTILR